MTEIARILCPIDFSDHSRRALDYALAIAHVHDSTLTLVHVVPLLPATAAYAPMPMEPFPVMTPEDRAALVQALGQMVADEGGDAGRAERVVRQGRAAAEILDAATSGNSDLIVMGTHGRTGFERLVLGSVTEKVLRKAGCPVLTVPRRAPDAVPATPGLFKEVLCATDFSDCATNALNYAMSLAQRAGAHLTVVHVVETPPALAPGNHETVQAGPRSIAEYLSAAEIDARARLDEEIPANVRAYIRVATAVTFGRPHREILRLAHEHRSDLIVVGIHGRGATDLMFFGSTAQHLVRQAECPVLTVRHG
jgi:nucleotide-binding universal stress UspA family protein